VTQREVDHFAEATGNRAPIHVLLADLWELRAGNGVVFIYWF
jgi:hypothetical protein